MKKLTTSKRVMWAIVIWAMALITLSYVLSFFERDPLSSLSEVLFGGTVGVVIGYLAKALLEKREDFGSVGHDESSPENLSNHFTNLDKSEEEDAVQDDESYL